jgi:hypothetical protein
MRRDQAWMRRAKAAQRAEGARKWEAIRARVEGRRTIPARLHGVVRAFLCRFIRSPETR